MNDVSQQKKDSVLKSLAIAGFVAIIILIAWLSVQLVNVVPGAFSSLASLAESINQREQVVENEVATLLVTSNSTLVNTGEVVTIAWNTAKAKGSYTFSYECTDGMAVDLVNTDGTKSISCDTNYNIGDTDTLTITADSEKERFAELKYTIAFLGTNDTKPRATGNASLTVVNSDIRDEMLNPDETTEETPVEETVAELPTEAVTPTYTQEYTYTIPVSDPNGRTDLGTRFLNTGRIIGQTFFPGELMQNETGAIQFEVKNYGSKTSEVWTFSVTLPNGGTFESEEQNPLKPNERAVLTIGFAEVAASSHTFNVAVEEATDQTPLNDRFSRSVTFTK